MVSPGAPRSTRNAGELLAVDLGEHREQIGEAGVGDVQLRAGQLPALAVGRQHRLGLGRQRVGARARLGQRVGGDQLAASPAWAGTSAAARRCRTARSASCRCPTWAPKLTRERPLAAGRSRRSGWSWSCRRRGRRTPRGRRARAARRRRPSAAARASARASWPRSRRCAARPPACMKSSAVSFIIRCSSESISGVKMVAEPVGSSRNPPPGDNVMVGAPMATGYQAPRAVSAQGSGDYGPIASLTDAVVGDGVLGATGSVGDVQGVPVGGSRQPLLHRRTRRRRPRRPRTPRSPCRRRW